MIISWLNT